MANYRWSDYKELDFRNRYPEEVEGYNVWRSQPLDLESKSWDDFDLFRKIGESSKPKLDVPKVFISHRQSDTDYAERIAYLACKKGFEYWQDIYDPDLQTAKPCIAIASIIEIALLNCSHVIVAYTPNTKGSEWVPYEYGRVKIFKLTSHNVACWIHKDVDHLGHPDYFELGRKTWIEKDITDWFENEYTDFYKDGNGPPFKPTCKWNRPIPPELPVPDNPSSVFSEQSYGD